MNQADMREAEPDSSGGTHNNETARYRVNNADYPTFEEAETQFRAFLAGQGFRSELIYLTPSNVVVLDGRYYILPPPDPLVSRTEAKACYCAAADRSRGVLLAAFCMLGNRLCAYVYGPSDEDEATRLMYPDGLKLSVPQPLKSATAVSGSRWWYLRCREALEGSQARLKHELFK